MVDEERRTATLDDAADIHPVLGRSCYEPRAFTILTHNADNRDRTTLLRQTHGLIGARESPTPTPVSAELPTTYVPVPLSADDYIELLPADLAHDLFLRYTDQQPNLRRESLNPCRRRTPASGRRSSDQRPTAGEESGPGGAAGALILTAAATHHL